MRSLLHLFALSEIVSLTLANNLSLHRHLLSRQAVDCVPILLQNPTDSDVQCGGDSTYLSPQCTCCPRGASGFIGCYTATDVCSVDPYGDATCCPKDEPDCAAAGGSAATTTSPSSSTTASDYPGSATTSTQPDLGSAATSTQLDPDATPTSIQNNTSSATTTSAVATVSPNGASTFMPVELKSLVMIVLLGLV